MSRGDLVRLLWLAFHGRLTLGDDAEIAGALAPNVKLATVVLDLMEVARVAEATAWRTMSGCPLCGRSEARP